MSNSSLVNYTRISPNRTSPRQKKITKITIHHMAGNGTVEACGREFASASRMGSSNYAIDSMGRVGMYVEEKDRAWTSSSPDNDHRAVTIEVANDRIGGNWHVSDRALAKLIDLCVDICRRNDIKRLNFTGDKNGNLTMHKYFAATACPGPYLESKFPYIAAEVNKRLGDVVEESVDKPAMDDEANDDKPCVVRVTAVVLNVRKGPGTGYAITTTVRKGEAYTIVETKNGWGKLKSGAGWICLAYTE